MAKLRFFPKMGYRFNNFCYWKQRETWEWSCFWGDNRAVTDLSQSIHKIMFVFINSTTFLDGNSKSLFIDLFLFVDLFFVCGHVYVIIDRWFVNLHVNRILHKKLTVFICLFRFCFTVRHFWHHISAYYYGSKPMIILDFGFSSLALSNTETLKHTKFYTKKISCVFSSNVNLFLETNSKSFLNPWESPYEKMLKKLWKKL